MPEQLRSRFARKHASAEQRRLTLVLASVKGRAFLRFAVLICCSSFLLTLGGATAPADWHNSDPAEWSGGDVYQILNNSPWSKVVKISFSSSAPGLLGNSSDTGNNNNVNNAPPPGGMAGRRGMGGGRSGGTYSSGGRSSPSSDSKTGATEVTVQWQSALIVRLAAAKKAEHPVSAAALPHLNEYIIALIGLPVTAVGGRAASVDSDSTVSGEEEQRIEEHVRSSASLLRSGHEPITPSKVELDQGSDGRMLIHFPKSDPIKLSDKNVEFRLATGRAEVRKKFVLKELEYQGNLDL